MLENRELQTQQLRQTGLNPTNEELTSKLQAKNRDLVIQNGVLTY